MPCGARLELVQIGVRGEQDVGTADHLDVDLRVLPVLERGAIDALVGEELAARGWTRTEDGGFTKTFGDVTATVAPGGNQIRLAVEQTKRVAVELTHRENIAQGDDAARAGVAERADAKLAAALAAESRAAEAEAVRENVERILRVYEEVRAEAVEVINATTRRALERRAAELGAIESVKEGRAQDGSYELAIVLRT